MVFERAVSEIEDELFASVPSRESYLAEAMHGFLWGFLSFMPKGEVLGRDGCTMKLSG